MRFARIAVTITALGLAAGLAACGEDQTAQTPTPPPSDQQEAPAQATRPQVTQPAQPPANTTANAPGAAANADQRGTGSLAAAPPAGGGGAEASAFQSVLGRSLNAGPVTLRLDRDNRFVFRDETGRSVTGTYAYADGILTLGQPEGDVGQARFPMRCRFEPVSTASFRLRDVDGACRQLTDVTFSASG